MTSSFLVGMSSTPLPPPYSPVVTPNFSCHEKSYRNSCSSRGVTVTRGVIQCGCSAWVRETMESHALDREASGPCPAPRLGTVAFNLASGSARAADKLPVASAFAL